MKSLRTLLEGGNVFKDADGQPLTGRINQSDVPATVAWLEQLTGLQFPRDRWLGSTGKAPTSGDMDLAVDTSEMTKDQLAATLMQWIVSHKLPPAEWIKKGGEVHLRTPIQGRPDLGYVQTDFMFFPNLDWGTFFYSGGEGSAYKGMNRNVLMSSIAKQLGLKVGANGMFSRTSNQLVDGGMDPDRVAQALLGRGRTKKDLKNVESIFAALAKDKDKEAKVKDFRDYLTKEGLQQPDAVKENTDTYFLARLRDRIVNQGMQPLVEREAANPYQIYEAEEAGVGGKAKGIEHLEDYVFRNGLPGVTKALQIVAAAADAPAKTTTVKWDGKPAVIFGRKPETGEFVLTDGSGFEAKGYDGLATSPRMMADIQRTRSGARDELIQLYADLWPKLEAALPTNFRGYVKGDLLYMNTPPLEAGNYVFKPNTEQYRIPAKTSLGQRIGASDTGIAMHSMYADAGDARQPLRGVRFNEVPGLLLIEPIGGTEIVPDANLIKQIKSVANSADGRAIATLFNPAELRAQQITDLAKLCVDYINYRIKTSGNFDNLLPGFGDWLQTKVSPRKFGNIVEYLNSPASNAGALSAAFTLFLLLHDLKQNVLQQLDLKNPGHEGWVMATDAGYAKAVNRFDFTARNAAQNNPPAG
tara:strand:- start:655 stop:2577 length:1923 start_codon:yes stop_codon:yes gene_type:complete